MPNGHTHTYDIAGKTYVPSGNPIVFPATVAPAVAGEVGMNVTTGRLQVFAGGAVRTVATSQDIDPEDRAALRGRFAPLTINTVAADVVLVNAVTLANLRQSDITKVHKVWLVLDLYFVNTFAGVNSLSSGAGQNKIQMRVGAGAYTDVNFNPGAATPAQIPDLSMDCEVQGAVASLPAVIDVTSIMTAMTDAVSVQILQARSAQASFKLEGSAYILYQYEN